MGEHYFASPESRHRSRAFYADLLACAEKGACDQAETLARKVMEDSLSLWKNSTKP
jgi:DNA-binding FadR family transcriptional regulator